MSEASINANDKENNITTEQWKPENLTPTAENTLTAEGLNFDKSLEDCVVYLPRKISWDE